MKRVLPHSAALIAASTIGVATVLVATAPPAAADTAPLAVTPVTPVTVSADPLPTVQINGVAWSQAVVGNTVYVAGKFTNARPAGAAAGVSTTPRNNLLAYDIRTGELITSFAPSLNAQALVVTASPDGSRVYVGGDFTQVNGVTRNRVAAFDTATGALVSGFAPSASWQVRALAATSSTVYIGGGFASVGSQPRPRLAAVRSSDGGLLPWNPIPGTGSTAGNSNGNTSTSSDVMALVVTGGGAQVVAAGRFDTLNGVKATGVGALDPVTGATRPFAANQVITNQGANSAVYSLQTDGSSVYGTGYDFYGPGNLEGHFVADADGGALRMVNDCHGDTYSGFPMNGAYYVATHAHDCRNIGGFPEVNPRVNRNGLAFSLAAAGTVGSSTLGNGNLRGLPAPAVLPWYPELYPGTYTGQSQAAWSVAGNDRYVVFGGEFPRAGSTPQQGLVRYALPSLAPNKVGPAPFAAAPTAQGLANGDVRLTWRTVGDRDNENLTYRVYRDGSTTSPVGAVTAASSVWDQPTVTWTDASAPVGTTASYRVRAEDPFGNVAWSASVSVEVPNPAPMPPYVDAVLGDSATSLWRLDEGSGSTSADAAGVAPLTVTGVTRGRTGAIAADPSRAFQFNGTSGFAATSTQTAAPQAFSVEAWVKTSTTRGGKVIGFASSRTSTLSSNYDRHLYLEDSGRVVFGVYPGGERTLRSAAPVNDNDWHHLVGTLGPAGMVLYVDGQQVGARTDTTSAQAYAGYWRLGGDRTWGSTSAYLAGTIDEAAVYPAPLTAAQVQRHWTVGTTGTLPNAAPVARATGTGGQLTASFDGTTSSDADGTVASYAWDFGDGTTGTGGTPTHAFDTAGTYTATLTVTDDDGATDSASVTVTVTAPPANAAPTARFASSTSGLTSAFDARGSSDADGEVAGYAWDFGDDSTGTGATPTHAYAATGTYEVTLTVTDDRGATGTARAEVTVTEPPSDAPFIRDEFARTVTGGLGTADLGGAWSTASGGPTTRQSVSSGAALLDLKAAGDDVGAYLPGVSAPSADVRTTLALTAAPTGTGVTTHVLVRRVAHNTDYRARLRFLPDGTVYAALVRRGGTATEVTLGIEALLPLGGYVPGQQLRLRVQAGAPGATGTALSLTVWPAGTAEPSAPTLVRTDATAVLQAPGSVGLAAFLSGKATAPSGIRYTQLSASPVL